MKRDAHLRLYDLRVWRMPVSSSNSTPSTEYNRVEHIHVHHVNIHACITTLGVDVHVGVWLIAIS